MPLLHTVFSSFSALMSISFHILFFLIGVEICLRTLRFLNFLVFRNQRHSSPVNLFFPRRDVCRFSLFSRRATSVADQLENVIYVYLSDISPAPPGSHPRSISYATECVSAFREFE